MATENPREREREIAKEGERESDLVEFLRWVFGVRKMEE